MNDHSLTIDFHTTGMNWAILGTAPGSEVGSPPLCAAGATSFFLMPPGKANLDQKLPQTTKIGKLKKIIWPLRTLSLARIR